MAYDDSGPLALDPDSALSALIPINNLCLFAGILLLNFLYRWVMSEFNDLAADMVRHLLRIPYGGPTLWRGRVLNWVCRIQRICHVLVVGQAGHRCSKRQPFNS